tara:strand:+ start:330 stop:521 length:192 start_codon:yes stop_codon:yes gene_type:complete
MNAIIVHGKPSSDNDSEKAEMSVRMIQEALPQAEVKMFSGMGHFIPAHMGRDEFPELLEEILK